MATTLVRFVRSSATLDTPPCANRHHTRRSLLVVAVPTPPEDLARATLQGGAPRRKSKEPPRSKYEGADVVPEKRAG